ncbi:MAG: aldo/keto reductase [Pseudomonadota bacterium]
MTKTSILGDLRPIGKTGINVTPLGLGGAPLAGLFSPVEEKAAEAVMSAAMEGGVRLLDTAPFYGYGLSENRIGRAARLFGRDKVTISSKAGRLLKRRTTPKDPDDGWFDPLPFEVVFDYSYEGILRSVEDSLHRLGTDRIDILLMHDIGADTHGDDAHPDLMKQAMSGGAKAMQRLKEQGVVGAIGLGVNEWQVCAEALDHHEWDVFLLAGRYTLLEQSVLDEFFPLCQGRGASVIIGGPFNSGVLAGGDTYNYAKAAPDIAERVMSLNAICDSHGVPLKAAALQFVLRHPVVAAAIPGMRSKEEFEENSGLLDVDIPDGLWSDLKSADLLHPDAPT